MCSEILPIDLGEQSIAIMTLLFHGIVLGHDTSESKPSAGETQKIYGYVSCHLDMTKIMLKVAYNIIKNKILFL